MSNSRRDFIKITSLSAAALAVSGKYLYSARTSQSTLQPTVGSAAEEMVRTSTYCEVCFWKCAGWVYKNED